MYLLALIRNKMKIAIIITLILVAIVFITLVYFIGYLFGWYYSDRRNEEEIINLKKEIAWWKRQLTNAINEIDRLKGIEKECKWYTELLEKYQNRYWPFKRTIEDTYKEKIITSYKEWKTNKEIAEEIWCWISTIQRAVTKRGLKR